MAGIKANSATTTMADGDTSADKTVTGYITGERITLTTTPTGATYSWAMSKPSGATARADLDDDDAAGPTFVPDVAGYYVITVTVGSSTAYVIRIAVTQVAVTTPYEALRLTPIADSAVTAPAIGVVLYYSSTQSSLAIKTAAGAVRTVDTTAV